MASSSLYGRFRSSSLPPLTGHLRPSPAPRAGRAWSPGSECRVLCWLLSTCCVWRSPRGFVFLVSPLGFGYAGVPLPSDGLTSAVAVSSRRHCVSLPLTVCLQGDLDSSLDFVFSDDLLPSDEYFSAPAMFDLWKAGWRWLGFL